MSLAFCSPLANVQLASPLEYAALSDTWSNISFKLPLVINHSLTFKLSGMNYYISSSVYCFFHHGLLRGMVLSNTLQAKIMRKVCWFQNYYLKHNCYVQSTFVFVFCISQFQYKFNLLCFPPKLSIETCKSVYNYGLQCSKCFHHSYDNDCHGQHLMFSKFWSTS